MVDLSSDTFEFNYERAVFRRYESLGTAMLHGDMYEFEESSLLLIEKIFETPRTTEQLEQILAHVYQVPPDVARLDVSSFVGALIKCGLLHSAKGSSQAKLERVVDFSKNSLLERPIMKCWALARKNSIPFKCKLNVTHRCNLACSFCYNGLRPGVGSYPISSELSTEKIEAVLDEIRSAGTFIVTITGGEPFARRDLSRILQKCDDLEFAVEILSNGTVLSERSISDLRRHRIQMVVVPIFGATPATHDRFVGIPGAFERALDGIRALRKSGIEVGVRCAINKATFREWKENRVLVHELGARYFPHVQVHLSSDRLVDKRSLRLSDSELLELYEAGLTLNPGYQCEVGLSRFDIMPNGDVALCSLLTKPLGNILEKSFSEIWNCAPELQKLRSSHRAKVKCSGCSQDDEAYRCSADALFDDKDLEKTSSEAIRIVNVLRTRSMPEGTNLP